jgi:outer membrane protein assembly factor BamD
VTPARPRHPGRPRRLRHVVALAALALALAGCGASTLPAVHSEAERLDHGRRALASRDYNIAIELLKGYVANNAGGADVDLAIEMLGEAYLKIHEWAEAQSQLERLLRDYPESDSAAAGSFHLGRAYWGQARGPDFDQEFTVKALDQWDSYLRSYPDHWLIPEGEKWAQRARERLADKLALSGELYVKLRRPGPARIYFRRVLDEYPTTAVAQRAELGLALVDDLDGKHAEALATLNDLQSRHPGGEIGKRLQKELARIQREQKRGEHRTKK